MTGQVHPGAKAMPLATSAGSSDSWKDIESEIAT